MEQRHGLSVAVLGLFAFLALGTSKPKEDPSRPAASGSVAALEEPGKSNKMVGSCDRSETFYLDCTELYEPLAEKPDAEKKKCDSMGGKFRLGHCPRINAVSQCFEGNPGYLSGTYRYEGSKTRSESDGCPRGFRDYKAKPDLKAGTSPASCNAITTGGTCSQYSAVTAENERSCLTSGGEIKQPPEPCPTAAGLTAHKLTLKDGTTETEYYYSTPYNDGTGPKSWKIEEVAGLCALIGANCQKVVFPAAAGSASASPSASARAVTPRPPSQKKK